MKKILQPALLLTLLISLGGCRPGGLVEMPTKDKAIDCTERSIQEQAIGTLGDVTGLLTSADFGNPNAWLEDAKGQLGKIAGRLGVGGIDALLCMIGWREQQFIGAATSNPRDDLSHLASTRATLLLKEYGAKLKLE